MAKKNIATFLAPNKGLVIAGNHAYAYAGLSGTTNSKAEILNFTTGNYYTVGTFTCNGATRMDLVDVGSISGFELTLNGTAVLAVKVDTNDKDSPGQSFMEVLIPPRTKVILSVISTENTSSEKISASYTGRVYDA